MSIISDQFTRRFAPNCIDPNKLTIEIKQQMKDIGLIPISVILLDRVKEQVDKEITKNQLYYGPQGLGKSTVARIKIGYDVNNKQVPWGSHVGLYVNCSKDARIDDLRNKIENFCTMSSVNDDGRNLGKVVFFDEIDGVRSDAFFDALRGFMDVYESNVKFIATCNHINRVPAPLRSRFDPCINFAPINESESKELSEKYRKRLKSIWVQMLKRTTTDEAINQLAIKTAPDIRSGLKALQNLHENVTGELTIQNIVTGMTNFSELYDYIFTRPSDEDIHVYMNVRYLDKGYEVLQDIHTQFVDYIIQKHPNCKSIIGLINILAAEYQNAIGNGVDPFLCLKACIYKIVNLLPK